MSAEQTITSSKQFFGLIEKGVVLVDFWAPWCGPCKAMSPILESIAKKYKDKITVAKCNVDANNGLAGELIIQSIPTMLLYSDGELAERFVGITDEETLSDIIDLELS